MPKYTKCKMCGAELPIVKGKNFFCSDQCRKDYRVMRNREYNREYYLTHKEQPNATAKLSTRDDR